MNILIISDLHIGVGDPFDTFGWKEGDFIAMMKNTIKQRKIDWVVLNGDIFELMKYRMSDIQSAHPDLVEFLSSEKFFYIRGNHDIISDGEDSLTIENKDGRLIHIEHGHSADFLNGTKAGRVVSRLLFKLLKFLCRFPSLNRIYLSCVEIDDQIHHVPRRYNTFSYLKYALKLLKKYDVVIMGHTHKLEFHKVYYLNSKKRYLNTGTCSMGRFHGIILDTETLTYDTIKVEADNVIFREFGNEKKSDSRKAAV